MNYLKKNILALGLVFAASSVMATELKDTELKDYVDVKNCDQVIDKQLYQICYSYKNKGPLSGWLTLKGVANEDNDIKDREKFYNEDTIPMKYRVKPADYNGYGKDWTFYSC